MIAPSNPAIDLASLDAAVAAQLLAYAYNAKLEPRLIEALTESLESPRMAQSAAFHLCFIEGSEPQDQWAFSAFTDGVDFALEMVALASKSPFHADTDAIGETVTQAREKLAKHLRDAVTERANSRATARAKNYAPRDPEPHTCVPAIVEPDVAATTSEALGALAPLIRDESRNLRLLQRVERVLREVQNDPQALTERVKVELHQAFETIQDRYYFEGTKAGAIAVGKLAKEVEDAVAFLSGDHIPLSDGNYELREYGFLWNYLWDASETLDDLRERVACAQCLPNFEEMIRRDIASGHWPRKNE